MDIIYKRVMVYTLPGKQKLAGKAVEMQIRHVHPVSKIEGGKRRYYLPFCSDTNAEPLEISKEVYIKLRSAEKDFKEHPDRYRLVYDRKAFDRAYKNCTNHPDDYGSNAMFDFLFWSATELYHLMDKKYRVRMHLFSREEAAGEDVGCICMRRCCFYFINSTRSDVKCAPFSFVRDNIVPMLHKKLRTSSACIVLGQYTGKWGFSMNSEARDWMTSTILKEYEAYRKRIAAK